MKHILIIAISLRFCVCRFAIQERQWTESDSRENCTNICDDACRYCPDPKVCNDEQLKCGETYHVDDVHGIMYDCMPDEICIPEGCLCPTMVDGVECSLVCPPTCNEDEILCPGGQDEDGCPQNDVCISRRRANDGEWCPGVCPVTCSDDKITCPQPDDPDTGCNNAPICVPIQKDINGKECSNQQCPVLCDESEHFCAGDKDRFGCQELDICLPKNISNTNEYCPGICPQKCDVDEILCSGQKDCETGCFSPDTCVPKGKDVNGNYCPDNSASHECPIRCCNDTIPCKVTDDHLGCLGIIECVPRSYGTNGTECPDNSVCPVHCDDDELKCPLFDKDENGCTKPDLCVHQDRDVNGDLCPSHCPVTCKDEEIFCAGHRNELNCLEADHCEKREKKKWGDDKGGLCPGYCPIECKNGEILCPTQLDPCDGCPSEPLCVPKQKNFNGEDCPDNSASHGCPKTCSFDDYKTTKDFVLCDLAEDSLGCKPEAKCLHRALNNKGDYCPAGSVCQAVCKIDEINCNDGFDSQGCRRTDICIKSGRDKDGNLCQNRQCPKKCSEDQIRCTGKEKANGCIDEDQCLDLASFGVGNDRRLCPAFCEETCSEGEVLVDNGVDNNGCIIPPKCSDGTQNTPQVGAISVFTTAAAPLTATAASPTPIQQWTTEAPIQQGYQGSGSQANADSGAYAEFVQGPGFTTAAQQQECADTGAAAYCEFVKNNDQCGDPSFSNTCLQSCEMC